MDEIVIKEGIHFVGKPCVKCGSCLRYTNGRRCAPCVKEYQKTRIQKNRKEGSKNGIHFVGKPCIKCGGCVRYIRNNKCLLCTKKYRKQKYQDNKENELEATKQWFDNNPGYKELYGKRWRENNPDYQKEWDENNPEKRKKIINKRRARKNSAEGDFTAQEWIDLCNQCGNKCIVPGCKNTKLEADHIVPLSEGGTNYIWNIQPLCRSHNASKGVKTIDYRQTTHLT